MPFSSIRWLVAPLSLGLILAFGHIKSIAAQPEGTGHDVWVGTWWIDFDDQYGGWLQVSEGQDGPEAQLLWRVGSARQVKIESISEKELVLTRQRRGNKNRFVATMEGDAIRVKKSDGTETGLGGRCPEMPPRPDLTKVSFGEPIALFNGRDLTGWQLQPMTAENGWRVEQGELVNETPKTDFSAYGDFGNLRTTSTFGDGRLKIDFNVGEKGNSGIYIRGLYEAQVVDRDSSMQGISGPGAIFGRVAPSENAGRKGGQWQSYVITLVDRHLSVELNGKLVIDNQPVPGCTGGAIHGNVSDDAPLYLQGDHTSVRYRNIIFQPRLGE